MRSGEEKRLLWADIDFERLLIILNYLEKGSNLRIFPISQKLIDMLNAKSKINVYGTRERLAHKLQNPRESGSNTARNPFTIGSRLRIRLRKRRPHALPQKKIIYVYTKTYGARRKQGETTYLLSSWRYPRFSF